MRKKAFFLLIGCSVLLIGTIVAFTSLSGGSYVQAASSLPTTPNAPRDGSLTPIPPKDAQTGIAAHPEQSDVANLPVARVQGRPAIQPHQSNINSTTTSSLITKEDVVQYVAANSVGGTIETLSPASIEKAKLLSNGALQKFLGQGAQGQEDSLMVWYVKLRGSFSIGGTEKYNQAIMVFDAQTGNILFTGTGAIPYP